MSVLISRRHVTRAEPGIDTRLVSNIDILPTALEAAGITSDSALPAVDGRSVITSSGHSLILSEYREDTPYTPVKPAPIPTWAASVSERR